MASISRLGSINPVNSQGSFFRLLVCGASGLLSVFQWELGICQEFEQFNDPLNNSRKVILTEAQSLQLQGKSDSRSEDSELSPKLPRVPSVVEMTGKMRGTESVLQSSGSRASNLIAEVVQNGESDEQREWNNRMATWASPNFFSHPLYFEQANLERYQTKLPPAAIPLISYAHFLGSIPTVPYQCGYKHPTDRSYSLGHWRPGDPVVNRVHWTPFTKRGLIYQGVAVAGGVFVLP